ncbi:MAG TPA: TfoX/Sxy family protein [Gemmatimonadaceae bacterium]|nr:TfoX/Sxy family protein [Gemmatimonadaceae bacterium]
MPPKKAPRKMPVFSKPAAATLDAFERATGSVERAERRTMFGYPSLFLGGNMMACVFQDRIMVRLSEADRAAAMKIPGAKPFEPSPGRAMKEYVDFPRAVIDDPGALANWFGRAARYVGTLPAKAAKSPKKKAAKKR